VLWVGWPIDLGRRGEIEWLRGALWTDRRERVRGFRQREAASRLVRPLARAADGIVHNRERRMTIHRYRCVARVTLVGEDDEQQRASNPGGSRVE
jgi:hypothetical protein